MSAPKHTPGPWRVGEFTRTSVEGGAPCHEIGAGPEDDGRCVALAFNHNARLIAAAPSLLAALTQAVEQLEADYEESPLDGHAALIRKLRAVIAEAEGREVPEPVSTTEET